jgi:hypothetical protein
MVFRNFQQLFLVQNKPQYQHPSDIYFMTSLAQLYIAIFVFTLWVIYFSFCQTLTSYLDTLTNNNAPVFENLNNEAKDAYEFLLPMPFPKGVAVNWAFGVDMKALDYDIGNEGITFGFEGGSNENFEIVPNGASTDPKQRFSFAIKTLKLLELTEPTSFTIIATVSKKNAVTNINFEI